MRHARRAHLAPLGVGSPRASKCGPGPAEGAQLGPRQPRVQVRPAGLEARAPRALSPRCPFQRGGRRKHGRAERVGSCASRAQPGQGPLEGGESSGPWRPCHSAGGEGRRPGLRRRLTALQRSGSRIRGGNLHAGHRNPSSASSTWKGFVNTEGLQGFQNFGSPFPTSFWSCRLSLSGEG